MSTTGKILIVGFLALGIITYREINGLIVALNNVSAQITGLHSLWVGWNQIDAKINLKFTNNTDFPIGIYQTIISIDKVDFYNKKTQNFIGSAKVDVQGIQIKAFEDLEIKNIHVKIPMKSVFENANLFKGNIHENIYVIIAFKSFGETYLINSQNYL